MTTRASNRDIDRRALIRGSALASGAIALAAPFGRVWARMMDEGGFHLQNEGQHGRSPYGPLFPVVDETTGLPLLKLPRGFHYFTVGWTGDVMGDGTLTPDRHDGMAVVIGGRHGGDMTLIRNHERGASGPGDPLPVVGAGQAPVYDRFVLPGVLSGIGGGTTALTFRHNGQPVDSRATLGGTLTNCAGGPTPWGSWLTCEEVTIRGSAIGARDHGYVFEVPAPSLGRASAVPLKALGFMSHEAVAVDARTGIVYETEDNGPNSGFYRFLPNIAAGGIGTLEAGGKLEMLAVAGMPKADLRSVNQGDSFPVQWVPIANPDANPEGFAPPAPGFPPIGGVGRSGPYLQGEALGGARFARGEGCWYQGGVIYFVDTSGGPAGKGVLWAYQPPADEMHGQGRLTAIFVSPNDMTADNPDNVTVSPNGGLLMCEDGGGHTDDGGAFVGARLIGLDRDGSAFSFAENDVVIDSAMPGRPFVAPGDHRGREFAGATFDPKGLRLFVNIQTPGITFVIKGPFSRGPL